MAIRNVTVRSAAGLATYHAILTEHPDHTRYQHHDCWEPIWCHLAPPDDWRLPLAPVALLTLRCGQCPPCREARARRYTAQGADEGESAWRIWGVTLTLPPRRFNACTSYREKELLILKEAQDGIKRLRERLRAQGRRITFRYFLTVEEHTGERTPDRKPTSQTGNPHVHVTIYEAPPFVVTTGHADHTVTTVTEQHRISGDELELMWARFPKFEEIPRNPRRAIEVAEARGYKLGNADASLRSTLDPADAGKSNRYLADPRDAARYDMKYLSKDTRRGHHGEATGQATALPAIRKPPPIRHSLFFGLGWAEALVGETAAKMRAELTRRITRNQRDGAKAPIPATAGPGASGEPGLICPLSDFRESLRVCVAWPHEGLSADDIERIMAPIRQRYIEKRRPLIMASAEAIRRARDGPDANR